MNNIKTLAEAQAVITTYMHPYGMPLSRNRSVDERLPVRRKKKELTEKEKERIHQKYKSFQHEYVIHGEVIKASNRKCALKIWERRHENKNKI